MAAGMKDVASLAGVAVGTVSNVLNHPDLVRPLTRARVEAAMDSSASSRTAPPRQLRAGRSRCLGLVVLDVTNPFFTEVARGVEDYAQAAGYAVICATPTRRMTRSAGTCASLEEQRVRGILITPVHGRAPSCGVIRDRGHPRGAARPAGLCRAVLGRGRRPPRRRDRGQPSARASDTAGSRWSNGRRRSGSAPTPPGRLAGGRAGGTRPRRGVLTEVTVPAMNAPAGRGGRRSDRPRAGADRCVLHERHAGPGGCGGEPDRGGGAGGPRRGR